MLAADAKAILMIAVAYVAIAAKCYRDSRRFAHRLSRCDCPRYLKCPCHDTELSIEIRHAACICKHRQTCEEVEHLERWIPPSGCEDWTPLSDGWYRSPDGRERKPGITSAEFLKHAWIPKEQTALAVKRRVKTSLGQV